MRSDYAIWSRPATLRAGIKPLYSAPCRRRHRRIAVIGAGIAGLTAAYTLQKRGFAVQVFEREATPGGRMRSEQHGDFVIERGAQFIASSYRNMRALAAELGIADLHRAARRHAQRRAAQRRVRTDGLRGARCAPEVAGPLSPARSCGCWGWPGRSGETGSGSTSITRSGRHSWTTESAAAYVERLFGREAVDYLIEPAFAGTFTVLPEAMSKAFMMSTLATVLRGFRLLSFRGGNGVLTRTLAARVPVRLSAAVEQRGRRREAAWPCTYGARSRRSSTPPSSRCPGTLSRPSARTSPRRSANSSQAYGTPRASSPSCSRGRRRCPRSTARG